MSKLSFKLNFKTSLLNSLDIPLEIRRPNSSLIARTLASREVDLNPGTYYVAACLPGGQRLVRPFEIKNDAMTVELAPDPDDESPHEWEEVSHFLGTPSLQLTSHLSSRERSVQTEARPSTFGAHVRIFSGNPVEGTTHIEPPLNRLAEYNSDPGRAVQFGVSGGAPVVVQLIQPGQPIYNMAIPVPSVLMFSRREDGACGMEAHLPHPAADMMLRYCGSGSGSDALETTRSTLIPGEGVFSDKINDPVAAAVTAYAILRYGSLAQLQDWTANLRYLFGWMPDIIALRAEHLARKGDHEQAALLLFDLPKRGLPTMADGLFYAVERLKCYAMLSRERNKKNIDIDRAVNTLSQLQPFALATHRQRAITSYPGADPSIPDVSPAPLDFKDSNALDLSEWLAKVLP